MALEDVVMEMFEGNKRDVIIAAQSVLLDKAVHSGYCNWGFLDENIVKTGVAFALPHGSPYKTYVDALYVEIHLLKRKCNFNDFVSLILPEVIITMNSAANIHKNFVKHDISF